MWQRSLASLRPAHPLTSLVLYFLNFERRQKRPQNLEKISIIFRAEGWTGVSTPGSHSNRD